MIVVLVILAILAAILVPALLGYIDEARNKQYVLQARNIIIAAQTVADEAYAAGDKNPKTYVETKKEEIRKIADVAELSALGVGLGTGTTADESHHDDYTIKEAMVTFKVETGGDEKTMYLSNGAWTESKPTGFKADPSPAA